LPAARYQGITPMTAFYRQLLPRLASQPGIEAVAAASGRPLMDRSVDLGTQDFEIEGQRGAKNTSNANFMVISPDFFRVTGTQLLRGRLFSDADDLDHPQVAIINQTMAHLFWPKSDPVGQRILLGNHTGYAAPEGRESSGTWATVVGVVADIKQTRVIEAPVRQEMFFPLWQRPEFARGLALMVRSRLDKDAAIAAVRRQVLALDPQQPISGVYTMEKIVEYAFGAKPHPSLYTRSNGNRWHKHRY